MDDFAVVNDFKDRVIQDQIVGRSDGGLIQASIAIVTARRQRKLSHFQTDHRAAFLQRNKNSGVPGKGESDSFPSTVFYDDSRESIPNILFAVHFNRDTEIRTYIHLRWRLNFRQANR